jgi:ankyrin repeat protein
MKHTSFERIAAFENAASSGEREEVKRLLAEGMDVNSAIDDGSGGAIDSAVMHGHLDIVRDLLEAGAYVDGVSSYDTPLMSAATVGRDDVMQLLLDAGADVHRIDDEGHTALWYAQKWKREKCEALLRQYGLDYAERERNDAEKRAWEAAKQKKVAAKLNRVRTKNREVLSFSLQEAITANLPKHALRFIERGAQPDFREEDGLPTALTWAVYEGHIDVVRAALKAGAAVNERVLVERQAIEGPPLIFAAAGGHLDAVKALVEADADVDAVGYDNSKVEGPAVAIAAARGHRQIVEYLLPLTYPDIDISVDTFIERARK